jgi:hypothetical protein
MKFVRASAPAAALLLSMLSGCPGDGDKNTEDAGSNVDYVDAPDSGMVACPADTPEFVATPENGISAEGDRGLYKVQLIASKPEELVIKDQIDWTVLITDADGKPADVGIAAACAYMPVHGHGLPPFDGVEKLSEPGQYKLKGLFFMMSGPWEVQFAIAPADEGETPVSYTSCDAKAGKRHPAKDYAVLNLCLKDN